MEAVARTGQKAVELANDVTLEQRSLALESLKKAKDSFEALSGEVKGRLKQELAKKVNNNTSGESDVDGGIIKRSQTKEEESK